MGRSQTRHAGWNRVERADTPPEVPSQPAAFETASDGGPLPLRTTFIRSGAIFEGVLSLRGDFEIDTEFHGQLETDGAIIVGPNGSIEGDLHAREVIIRGAVVGNVTAPRQVIVEATAKLHGDIETVCLEIEKHAFFRGTTRMLLPEVGRLRAPAQPGAPTSPTATP